MVHVVVKKMSAVNYRIKEVDGRKKCKTVHVNNMKSYKERELEVCALTVVAEENEMEEKGNSLHLEACVGFDNKDIEAILGDFKDVMSKVPGKTDLVKMDIHLQANTQVISQMPYRLPDRLKEAVKHELDDLREADIIEASDCHWASPLVPVAKPNGKVRLCVDFKRLPLSSNPISHA